MKIGLNNILQTCNRIFEHFLKIHSILDKPILISVKYCVNTIARLERKNFLDILEHTQLRD